MDRFIARENIKRFKNQLEQCSDDGQRQMLEQLLAEAEATLAELQKGQIEAGASLRL